MLNTLKTTLGFMGSLIRRISPLGFTSTELSEIYNYLVIADLYATSGQPDAQQFEIIAKSGYQVVVNLAPLSLLENSLIEEKAILERLGLSYVHIPVDFSAPAEEDYQQFVHSLRVNKHKRVWVHCAANMRVSAFTYRYRLQELAVDKAQASHDLRKIWEPFGVWQKFIRNS